MKFSGKLAWTFVSALILAACVPTNPGGTDTGTGTAIGTGTTTTSASATTTQTATATHSNTQTSTTTATITGTSTSTTSGTATKTSTTTVTSTKTSTSTTTVIAVNGACGSANGVAVASAPSSGLCGTGSASAVTGTGPFAWICAGSNGGSNASCSAPLNSVGTGATGFIDTYPGATWGFSAYKLSRNYSGAWGTLMRQSDNSTLSLGFDSTGKADIASFNSFCSGTNCYVMALNDQVNGVNAVQNTLSKMPRVMVNSHNALAVCPQPTSSMATPYNAAVNTPKVHLFAVVRAGYQDSRPSQADEPGFHLTGNVTAGSGNVTSLSSVFGLSAANGLSYGAPMTPGIVDTAGAIPGLCGVNALSGTTASLNCPPYYATATAANDGLTYYNANLPGAWIVNGPAGAHYDANAYWGMGIGSANNTASSDWIAPRNGTIGYLSSFQSIFGEGMRAQWAVYDYDTYGTQLDYDGVNLGSLLSGSPGTVTYKTNTGLTLFSDASGAESPSQSCFETMLLYPDTQTGRVAMANSLMSQDSLSFPFAPNTADGFAWTGQYEPSFQSNPDNAFGKATVGPDSHGMSWNIQSGGYTWPSAAYAANVNNGASLWRFVVQPGDSDVNITGAERSEINVTTNVVPGKPFSIFYQFEFEQLPDQNGDWCVFGQVHYNDAASGANSPDIVSVSCKKGEVGQFQLQKTVGGNPVTTSCGSPLTVVPGETYAVYIKGTWSASHTADTVQVYAGPNGSPLSEICNVGPAALWDNDTGAYLKGGIYRGYPGANAGTVIERVMNPMQSATANAYDAYITAQPALPTHP